MNNVCGVSTMLYEVMRIDSRRWSSLIIRCSVELMLQPEQTPFTSTGAANLHCHRVFVQSSFEQEQR